MCLIVFAYKQHPAYDLILAANRDEEYKRPTRPVQFWNNHPDILAGKDLQAGGTWMGVTMQGQISAITNFRDPNIQKNDPPSRGHLVLDYLKKDEDPLKYLKKVDQKAERYMGFNIIAGTVERLAYYSNQQSGIQLLDPGLHGLSNHLLDSPWPKVEKAKNDLRHIIQKEQVSAEALFELLRNDRQFPAGQLPDTGIPEEIEKKVSPVFIKGEEYGTRCSTVLLIDKKGEVTFTERRFKAGTRSIENESRFRFTIEK